MLLFFYSFSIFSDIFFAFRYQFHNPNQVVCYICCKKNGALMFFEKNNHLFYRFMR